MIVKVDYWRRAYHVKYIRNHHWIKYFVHRCHIKYTYVLREEKIPRYSKKFDRSIPVIYDAQLDINHIRKYNTLIIYKKIKGIFIEHLKFNYYFKKEIRYDPITGKKIIVLVNNFFEQFDPFQRENYGSIINGSPQYYYRLSK